MNENVDVLIDTNFLLRSISYCMVDVVISLNLKIIVWNNTGEYISIESIFETDGIGMN